MRPLSSVAPEWWDYTTLDKDIVNEAARLSPADMLALSRDGFRVVMYDTIEDFYLAEALEYIQAWQQSRPDAPCGICGPIGPTEQLPLVARIVNSVGIDLRRHDAHFWGMDEWVLGGKTVGIDHPLSFAKADRELCFDRIDPALAMPEENLHFPLTGGMEEYSRLFDEIRCVVMQGGQGDVKHWAFNDPLRRDGQWTEAPPPPEVYRQLATRVVDLHPMTVMQNARTSGGGNISLVPTQAATVGPVETWKAEKVSIWHAGCHDNPFGMRLTTLMIAQQIPDAAVPMSLLAGHPNVQFNFFRPGLGTCEVTMH